MNKARINNYDSFMAKKFDLESAVVPFYSIESRNMIDEVLCSESVKSEKGGKRGRKIKEV